MKKYYYPVFIFLTGVFAAQVCFSILVYFSNQSLYQTLQLLRDAGYLIVPNAHVMPGLQKWMPAVCGGLFFSMTIGAGLSLITLLTAVLWLRYFQRFRASLIFLVAGTLFFFSFQFNFAPGLTLSCVIPAGIVFYVYVRCFSDAGPPFPFLRVGAVHLASLAVIAAVWAPVADEDIFVAIRDNLLLTHPVGRSINDFYYKYTLYPAETFKSLNQKLLKSCHITDADSAVSPALIRLLVKEDYLPVKEKSGVDLIVHHHDGGLTFQQENKVIDTCRFAEFQKDPEEILAAISQKTDDTAFLRRITFLSLIGASPLLCYLLLHAAVMTGIFFIPSPAARFAAAAVLCVAVFSLPAVLFSHQKPEDIDKKDIVRFLASDHSRDRVLALKAISEQDLTISHYGDPEKLVRGSLTREQTVERYWLAKSLAGDRSQASYDLILRLLDDPQPNVACMAFYSLGQQSKFRNSNRTKKEILRRLTSRDHWYVQWYAYKALKRLGWTQTPPRE